MAVFLSVTLMLFLLFGSSVSYQEANQRISNLNKKPCKQGSLCEKSDNGNKAMNRASESCHSDEDCSGGEYCHRFHRLCLRPKELVTVAPMKTSAKRCSDDSDCKTKEYCHEFWKICLPSQAVYKAPPTKRPSWYCRTSKDCKKTEQCHKRFHACYTRPGMSTVRRDTGNSRRCENSSDCGANFYCHNHFRICLEITTTDIPTKSPKNNVKPCSASVSCPKDMLCHNFWNICYTPSKIAALPKINRTQQCRTDSDCRADELCHTMATGHVLARLKRNIKRVCIPRMVDRPTSTEDTTCKTDSDCGPNKCCLQKLGVCMSYKLPGDMCLVEKSDLVCGCTSGSYCKTRGKWASPRRIANKMKLPQTVANHFLKTSNRKKRKVGKCVPSSF